MLLQMLEVENPKWTLLKAMLMLKAHPLAALWFQVLLVVGEELVVGNLKKGLLLTASSRRGSGRANSGRK